MNPSNNSSNEHPPSPAKGSRPPPLFHSLLQHLTCRPTRPADEPALLASARQPGGPVPLCGCYFFPTLCASCYSCRRASHRHIIDIKCQRNGQKVVLQIRIAVITSSIFHSCSSSNSSSSNMGVADGKKLTRRLSRSPHLAVPSNTKRVNGNTRQSQTWQKTPPPPRRTRFRYLPPWQHDSVSTAVR